MRHWLQLCAAGLVWAATASGATIQNPSFESFDDGFVEVANQYLCHDEYLRFDAIIMLS